MTAKEKKAVYDKEYREKNKEKVAAQDKKYALENKERLRAIQKRYYYNNLEKCRRRGREDYHKNRDRKLEKQKEYREKFIKPYTGKIGTGNYNITLAERYKEEWKKETLYLYLLEMEEETGQLFYKYGLTKNMKQRLYHIPYKVKILQLLKMNKYEAVYRERLLLDSVNSYCPTIKFGGYKECFLTKYKNKN